MCLPNKRDLDTWYNAVYALPIAWPDVTDIDTHYFKNTSANQLLALRTQMGVSHMWGKILPQWHLLRHHLWNLGPRYLNAERLEELLILNRPKFCPVPTGRNGGTGNLPKMSSRTWALLQDLRVLRMRTKHTPDRLQRWGCHGHHVQSS